MSMNIKPGKDMPLESLPDSWQRHILRLRQESSRHRAQRNAAREEADRLRAELAELKAGR